MPQGYPIRTDDGCPAPSYSGGGTWGDWQTCCPPNTYCPQGQYNAVCFQSGAESTLSQCANSTWDLYVEDNYYFCCEEGKIGFTSLLNDSKGFFGCSTKAKFDSADMNSLTIRVPGTVTPTASPTSTISQASTTTTTSSTSILTSTSTSTSTSDPSSTSTPTPTTAASSGSRAGSTNTGAIAGGVVGGVCGVALIAVLIRLVFRNRAKASKNQEKPLSPGSDQQNVGFYSDSHVVPAHFQGNQGRSPFQSPPGSDKPSELPTEYRPLPAELPSR